MTSSELAPVVVVHYGIPSTASILAYDPIQSLLAVGTLDGRIKVVGGDNIEGLLTSFKAVPFKNLEFLQNQGFLVSVSYENEIQVWDLVKRRISSNMQWESNITAFSVVSGTNYMYVGDEYGFLSVLKYDAEEEDLLQLPYHVPPNLIAEGAGVSLPDHLSIVGVLNQPCSGGDRVLIAYENGLIILWDVTQDKAVQVKGYNDLQLKGGTIVNFSDDKSHTFINDSLDNEETQKEISSLCWVSPDGSVLAVGYVDGDILLWNLSVPHNGKSMRTPQSNDVVKIQLSSGDSRLPVIVLRWGHNKAQNGQGGQLFAYGGEEIGSDEVLTILDLDWSSGLAKLKCIERVDLALHGSFADVITISNPYKMDNDHMMSLFVLTNPGQLHFYQYSSLSILKSDRGINRSVHALQYYSVIPTAEPYMTLGKLYTMHTKGNILRALLETVSPPKHQLNGGSTKWPLTGGVLHRVPTTGSNNIKKIYIGGYQDGSVRIWDATFPVMSLVSVFGFEIKGIQVAGATASISALDFCSANLTLAFGNENGSIFLYRLQGTPNQTTITVVTESKCEDHQCMLGERIHCYIIYSLLKSPVCVLQFTTSGARLVAGFESGQKVAGLTFASHSRFPSPASPKVAVLDSTAPSVLFITDSELTAKCSAISLVVKTTFGDHENNVKDSDYKTEIEYTKEIAIVLSGDAHVLVMDCTSGNMINSLPLFLKEKSIAISMHLLEVKHQFSERIKDDSTASFQHSEVQSQPLQTGPQNQHPQNQHGLSDVEFLQSPNLEYMTLASQILLCCEDAFYLYPVKSFIQGDTTFVHELELEKPCSWTEIIKRNEEKYGLLVVYQTGEIELRSLPELETLGKTSMMSILRWNFRTNMNKTMSVSEKGQITLVSGNEYAFVSLLASDNEFRIPETLPCLHDEVLAAAGVPEAKISQSQRKAISGVPEFVSNLMKGLKGVKEEQDINYNETHEFLTAHFEKIFSRFPFSDPLDALDIEDLELQIDDIDIDEPLPVPSASSSQDVTHEIKMIGTERERLFEGSSTDTKPTVRTREEIIAKYRKTGDVAGATSEAKDKLIERQEKLEKLSRRTEELQAGAQNFASLANELAKQMEKRKWWHI
ncbi:transducin family protein / WD-40 repeat family protein [Striga asiatica]|uniref:Transducin family protein / WD-40 repeat family protein n=1 Tax=Striga asiatica TaxID=4170 RepID=A0A5A7RB21_STRAF|nr:transducin family protein / WD-40 repeat family protein [Striga asiatica]